MQTRIAAGALLLVTGAVDKSTVLNEEIERQTEEKRQALLSVREKLVEIAETFAETADLCRNSGPVQKQRTCAETADLCRNSGPVQKQRTCAETADLCRNSGPVQKQRTCAETADLCRNSGLANLSVLEAMQQLTGFADQFRTSVNGE